MQQNFFFGHHRAQRGDLEPIILHLLCEQPMHGYEIIRTLEERSHGFWRPSPGSVYPILQFLEEQDLVESQERNGKKVYVVTDKGRQQCKEDPRQNYEHPLSEKFKAGLRFRDMRHLIRDTAILMKELAVNGTDQDLKQAKKIIQQTHDQLKTLVEQIEKK